MGGWLGAEAARRAPLRIAAWPALKAAKGSVVLMSGNSALFPKAPYAAVGTINAAGACRATIAALIVPTAT